MTEEKWAELNAWISLLECEPSSWDNYGKLAVLYTVRGQQGQTEHREVSQAVAPMLYSQAAAPEIGHYGNSDFLLAVEGKDPERVWPIVDELMDTLHVVNERVYRSVLRKINAV